MSFIIKKIINSLLDRRFASFQLTKKELEKKQEKLWIKRKCQLKGTSIYNDFGLKKVNSYQDYVKMVPVGDYDDYSEYIERVYNGEKSVLFNGKLDYFGLTSGTSGKDSKKIPYNREMIKLFKRSQIDVASVVNKLNRDIDISSAERFGYGSAPVCYEKNGFLFGYISGILMSKTSRFLSEKSYPTKDILRIDDWDEKVARIAEQTKDKDIKVISGIPTYIISILEEILKITGKKTIKEIWPNISIFIYGATGIDQYQSRIDQLVGRSLEYFGLYASTEAPLGAPFRSSTDGQRYVFNTDLLLSFTSVENPNEIIGIGEVESGHEYLLNIGTPNGLIHYAMKDIIRIFEDDNGVLTFQVVGRKDSKMNLAAEKVSERHILNTVSKVNQTIPSSIDHYFVSPSQLDGKPCYNWTLFVNKPQSVDSELLAEKLDAILMKECGDYEDCRLEGPVINPPKVNIVDSDLLVSYFEKHRNKGQFKMKTTFSVESEFKNFWRNSFENISQTA